MSWLTISESSDPFCRNHRFWVDFKSVADEYRWTTNIKRCVDCPFRLNSLLVRSVSNSQVLVSLLGLDNFHVTPCSDEVTALLTTNVRKLLPNVTSNPVVCSGQLDPSFISESWPRKCSQSSTDETWWEESWDYPLKVQNHQMSSSVPRNLFQDQLPTIHWLRENWRSILLLKWGRNECTLLTPIFIGSLFSLILAPKRKQEWSCAP